MFQVDGSTPVMIEFMLAGFELKIMRPTCWMNQSPLFVT